MNQLINEFIIYLVDNDVELYNEAGLQHELGFFMRVVKNIPVKFEYSIGCVSGIQSSEYLKKEMDLFFEIDDQKNCIELKFPANGAYPRRMTQSILDIYFLQQLVNNGFKQGIFFFITHLKNFAKGKSSGRIYQYFRNPKDVSEYSTEDIPKFFLKKNDGKAFYNVIENQTAKLHNPIFIGFNEIKIRGKIYYYFFIEIKN